MLKQIQHTLNIIRNNAIQLFESIAKTNTTHTTAIYDILYDAFESIAKTNTTHTNFLHNLIPPLFESIAKTNTTHEF